MDFRKTTEEESHYKDLEKMSIHELILKINEQDKTVPHAVEKTLPQIEALIEEVVKKLNAGGRLFYLGAGTSGRLGIVDASECPPTFGVPHNIVIGLIAGGDSAIRKAVEFAEDSTEQGWKDLLSHDITEDDFVVGIAASGTTPYVVGAIDHCNKNNILTGCITCNKNSPLARTAQFPIEVVVGPEFVTGSSRMKAGTAQKLVLNMITTAAMIQMGKVEGNRMVDMQLSNNKLVDRGTRMVMEALSISEFEASVLLNEHKNVRNAIKAYLNENG
ncbi:MAG: N-acetylmuramic acid 6-phosphate etherase [Flavobacteriaceae bacterium]|nr:N-acetylmuramic acid 6-phosphate etherase [Flavobacteriaceae bacterium]